MGMTAEVKAELSQASARCASARKAEVTAFLRFSSALRVAGGRAVIHAEVEHVALAHRVARDLHDLYGQRAAIRPRAAANPHGKNFFVLSVGGDAENLARQTGLIDHRGRPAFGLPAHLVRGSLDDAAAAWRGAFMASGALNEIGRIKGFSVRSPAAEASLALIGMARRLGVPAKTRDSSDVERVVVRDKADVNTLLTAIGAPEAGSAWVRRRHRATEPNALQANFESSNARRSAQAAADAVERVSAALTILGDSAPPLLAEAGRLRLEYPQATLEELGRKAESTLSKDTVAGRIRRLLSLADRTIDPLR